MRKKMALLICLGVGISSTHVEAITTWGRVSSMIQWGLAAGGMAYGISSLKDANVNTCPCPVRQQYGLLRLNDDATPHLKNAGLAGGATAVFTLWVTGYYTATHRLRYAQRERATIENATLFNHMVTSDNIHQISMATGAESTPMPLVTMHLELAKIDAKLSNIKEELEKALQDIYEYSELAGNIKCLLNQVTDDLARIRHSEYVVKNNDQQAWENQWFMHKGVELKEKQIAAQQSAASAQNSAAMAMWMR